MVKNTHVPFNDHNEAISVVLITQATAATFSDLFMRLTFLCFIEAGAKRVVCPVNGEIIAEEGDLIIFPAGSMVTLENRPLMKASYRAHGVYFSHDLINAVFADQGQNGDASRIHIMRADPHRPRQIFELIEDTLRSDKLPPSIRQHRLLEPLIWLRHQGIHLPVHDQNAPLARLRSLIEADPSRPWRAAEVAHHFAMSEPTFRRWLAKSGSGFAKTLHNTRLERGLALLQSTKAPLSQIALDCGFKTPSHFSDSFKKRFGIKPSAIRTASD